MEIKKTIKDWMLPIAMVAGASVYLIYNALPEPIHKAGPVLADIVALMQPMLIFAMLFLTFCRIEPKDLKPHRWHWWLLLVQGGIFILLGLAAFLIQKVMPGMSFGLIVVLESAMLCMICPTATAAAVVTRKLGGDVPGITTYVVLINLLAALLVPLVVPMVHPSSDADFWTSFSLILAKVFPLLITPCLCAWLVRYLCPKLHRRIIQYPDLPFYLWSVALTLAITITTKSIVHTDMKIGLIMAMSAASLVCCAFQFYMGRHIGSRYRPRRNMSAEEEEKGRESRKVTAGQSLGQKNTVFAIWLAYTFMTPETAIVGGLYSIWHNIYNSWQLYRANHQQ